jgi:hypothetical protein
MRDLRKAVSEEPDSWDALHDLGDALGVGLGYWEADVLDDPDLASLRGDPEFEAILETRTGRNRSSSTNP